MFCDSISVQLMFAVAIIGSILSFLPFYGCNYPFIQENPVGGIRNSYFYRESAMSTLVLIIPTSMDILLDVFLLIMNNITRNSDGNSKKPIDPILIVRLTVVERSLFVVGVAMQCIVTFVPMDADYLLVLYHCTSNCSTVLTICPILMFLERCTLTWTSMATGSVALFTAVGAAFNSASYCFEKQSDMERTLYSVGSIFFVIAAVVYIIICGLCASYYINQKSREGIYKRLGLQRHPGGLKREIKVVDEMYENYIPAAHIFSGIMFVILNATWNGFTADSGITFGQINYSLIGIATWVLVVEFRIKKNEVTRGLMSIGFKNALLDSKKSYIRYISHELRTPLNTAYLGLKLLSDETDPHDLDKLDTVSDVTAACKTAVDILNDLLCFDMLESGILELHKQEIAVLPFLYDNIKLFSTQAKGIGVDLTVRAGSIDLDTGNNGIAFLLAGSWVARPLHGDDCVFVDKFKMDQVIRNLISNALKFTPRGGSVSVTATFVPEFVERSRSSKSRSTNVSLNSSRDSSAKMPHRGRNSGAGNHFSFRRVYADSNDMELVNSLNSQRYPTRNVETVAGKLVVVVKDTGAGISESNQKRLFNEIVQFNPEILQAGGGSGLGLWITRGIVDLHDSTISVYSAGEGEGCIFTLEIPMQRKSSVHNVAPMESIVGLSALSRRASVDQEEAMAMRRSESWRYMLRQLDTPVGSDRDLLLSGRAEKVKEKDQKEKEKVFQDLPTHRTVPIKCVPQAVTPTTITPSASSRDLVREYPKGKTESEFKYEREHSNASIKSCVTDDEGPVLTNSGTVTRGYSPAMTGGAEMNGRTDISGTRYLHKNDARRCSDSLRDTHHRAMGIDKRNNSELSIGQKKMSSGAPSRTSTGGSCSSLVYPLSTPLKLPISYDLLVVDDSKLNRKMLCKVLRSEGHTCDEAEDGLVAIEKVKQRMDLSDESDKKCFDAILMDFVMPNMDGPTATMEIRALGYLAPIFGVTGNSLPSDVDHFIVHGANVVLIKPLDINDFKKVMRVTDTTATRIIEYSSTEKL